MPLSKYDRLTLLTRLHYSYAILQSLFPGSAFASTPLMTANRRVAVIGAGAAGLSAARELRHEGLTVTVFERSASVGGTWIYSTAVESDPLSLNPNRKIVHSSLYDSLRTKLPRESMGFLDYPFISIAGEEDCRRFPGHREVLRYLKGFAKDSELCGHIRFGTEVVRVEMDGEGRWAVVSRRVAGGVEVEREVFDAVVVCVGHYTEPRVAEIPGHSLPPYAVCRRLS